MKKVETLVITITLQCVSYHIHQQIMNFTTLNNTLSYNKREMKTFRYLTGGVSNENRPQTKRTAAKMKKLKKTNFIRNEYGL